jgi:hypothetical protein
MESQFINLTCFSQTACDNIQLIFVVEGMGEMSQRMKEAHNVRYKS